MGTIREQVKELRAYASLYKEPPHGKEVCGTAGLLRKAADTIEFLSAKLQKEEIGKSVLIIDTPESCVECPLKSQMYDNQYICQGNHRRMTIPGSKNKAEWCPLKKLMAHYAKEWIPCSEKLPEAGKFYIVTYRFEDETFLKCHELYYGTADGKTEPGWYLDDDGGELYKPFEVTAWQPLPEPYSPQ